MRTCTWRFAGFNKRGINPLASTSFSFTSLFGISRYEGHAFVAIIIQAIRGIAPNLTYNIWWWISTIVMASCSIVLVLFILFLNCSRSVGVPSLTCFSTHSLALASSIVLAISRHLLIAVWTLWHFSAIINGLLILAEFKSVSTFIIWALDILLRIEIWLVVHLECAAMLV